MKNPLRRSIAALLLLTTLAVMLFLLIPSALDTWVIPALLKRMSLGKQHASITRLTPFGASGTLRFKEGETAVLAVPRFEIFYSPSSLLNKRLTTLVLDHATLHLSRKDGRVYLSGNKGSAGKTSSPATTLLPLLPFMVDRLILQQCSLILHESNQPDLRLTVSAGITPEFASSGTGTFALESLAGTFILSEALSATGSLSFSQKGSEHVLSLQVNSDFFIVPDRFTPPSIILSEPGPLSANISLSLDKETLSLQAVNAQGTLGKTRLGSDLFSATGDGEERFFSFSISGPPTKLGYTLSSIRMISPLEMTTSVTGSASIAQGIIKTEGTSMGVIYPGMFDNDITVPFSMDYSGSYSPGGRWNVELSGQSLFDDPVILSHKALSTDLPRFTLSGSFQGDPDGLNGDFDLSLDPFELRKDDTSIKVSGMALTLRGSKKDEQVSAGIAATIPHISHTESGYFADDLQIELPLSYPLQAGGYPDQGAFSVGTLGLKKEVLGSLKGSIRQQDDAFDMVGSLSAAFDPELVLSFDGTWLPAEKQFDISWNLPSTLISSYSLPPIWPLPESVDFEAKITTKGQLGYHDNKLHGSMLTSLREGQLNISDKNIAIENVSCDLDNPRLPSLSSAPSQACTVEDIDIGTFSFSDGRVTFRLEDSRALFVENSSVKWSQGSLESGSMRLSPGHMEVDTTIYCNRVNFADLLTQFGFDQTEGEGALNGKLPVKISKNGIHFADGFLFSTPGTGGIVRFTNTDLLRQGMGAVTKSGYLGYSLMALEDFAYNWTRLSFKSSADDLLMTMELDGKPRSPLPFAFKNGMMVETDQGNGLQYPVRLDVNFNLPLNDLLQVGRNINSIMGNK